MIAVKILFKMFLHMLPLFLKMNYLGKKKLPKNNCWVENRPDKYEFEAKVTKKK